MARYAQGYERKSSDAKNLFILIGSIVGAVALSIVAVILINVFTDHTEKTYQSDEYKEFLVEADYLLKKEKEAMEANGWCEYYVYVYEEEATSDDDSNMTYVLEYLDEYLAASEEERKGMTKLYLFNYCDVEDDDDAIEEVENKLNAFGQELAATQLYHVKLEEQTDGSIRNVARSTSDRMSDDDATEKLKSFLK